MLATLTQTTTTPSFKMADKQKGSERFLFVEEGEVTDSDDEPSEAAKKKKRDEDFINSWTEARAQNDCAGKEEPKSEMDLSETEAENEISERPIGITITFRDETFSRKYREVVEDLLKAIFGPTNVDASSGCIFVFIAQMTEEVFDDTSAPIGVMTIIFHDAQCHKEHFNQLQNMCNDIFGLSKVTTKKYMIEVVKNELLDFSLDTSMYGGHNVRYEVTSNNVLNENGGNQSRRMPNRNCFNCGGDHNLNECRQPRDHRRIYEARTKLMNSKMKST